MLDILYKRRSIRSFTDKDIESEKIEKLKEALLLSPSSRNLKPCEFIFIDDKELLEQLANSKQSGSAFLKQSKLAVIFLGDTIKSDVCIEDCSIAAITLQYTAVSLGLGSCWSQIRLREHSEKLLADEFIRQMLNIKNRYMIECIVGIGYPKDEPKRYSKESLNFNKIHFNRFI